jgi:uncharacterized membrane protein YecN with MAPEG domain
MAYVDIVTALALLQYLVFGFKVARARGRYSVKAPAVAGNEIYLVGRELFAFNYVKEPAKREVGFTLTFLPSVILVLGGLFGAVRNLL